jgi:hypothetical protein
VSCAERYREGEQIDGASSRQLIRQAILDRWCLFVENGQSLGRNSIAAGICIGPRELCWLLTMRIEVLEILRTTLRATDYVVWHTATGDEALTVDEFVADHTALTL